MKKLTSGLEDSSPCWSPDGRWICFATKKAERRRLAKVAADGGAVQYLNTTGAPSPTEPDWSPDGKWIAFTAQMGDFNLCVVPAAGGTATVLVSGEDPSWAPNSRTLLFCSGPDHAKHLSLLDVPKKQVKHVARILESNSQPSWAK